MLPFRTFLRLNVLAKLAGKKKNQTDQIGIAVPCTEPGPAWFCPSYGLFSIFLNNSNDGVGSMLLKHTANAELDRAAKGMERNTMHSGEKKTVEVVWGEEEGRFNSMWKNARINPSQE